MKAITVTSVRRVAAFTLIEMIGVLSVLAILASMLLPRVFQAISSARINEAVASCNGARVLRLLPDSWFDRAFAGRPRKPRSTAN